MDYCHLHKCSLQSTSNERTQGLRTEKLISAEITISFGTLKKTNLTKCCITRNNYKKRTTGEDNEVKMIIMLDPPAKNIKKKVGSVGEPLQSRPPSCCTRSSNGPLRRIACSQNNTGTYL